MLKLWDTPEDSWNGASDIYFEFDGLNAKCTLVYSKFNITKKIIITFIHAIYFNHYTNYLFMPDDSYECLCQIKDSRKIKELKDFNLEYPIEKFKHFVISNENDGKFEIIAENYSIEII